mgnify:CR=1 FL=1
MKYDPSLTPVTKKQRKRYTSVKRRIKLTGPKARGIFQDERVYKQIAYDHDISRAAVCNIKQRKIYAWATHSLPDWMRG